ncbi:MAG: MBOAT family O-acyltransferase [Treponema sp.]|nr:MBOAT family protein [Spirochaetales bacterium]MDY5810586.1 MBOAT family O-acyltransferase [Treponema sp.]MEE1181904.1 MBOAT family O-acyltransferase [Treponema sp.]
MGIFIAEKEPKKLLLILAIVVNLGILFLFKYLGFSIKIVNALISELHLKPLTVINLVLPIGISFYTFQEISYLVDVYKDKSLVQKNVLNLGLYISFFPQLIAGPIVRYHDINNQIENRKETVADFSKGLERFIIGLSKKVILANNFALVCDNIYNSDFASYGTGIAWIAAIAYALQIYYDFSGYSDMAIGIARLFGFSLLENFNYPYAASSITDFWKRWHISLTNFFRDYVYIPLGGNRKGKLRTILNRFMVFFLTGLWHGAAFSFIFWGLAHGSAMVLERQAEIDKAKNIFVKFFYRVFTLFVIILFWVLFRNETKDTVKIWLKMFGVNYSMFTSGFHKFSSLPLIFYADAKFFILAFIGILFSFPWWKRITFLNKENCFVKAVKFSCLVLMLGICFSFLATNTYNPFIYFRF